MASHILSDLVAYFTLDEISIDNWVFKLFYKVSTNICMVGTIVQSIVQRKGTGNGADTIILQATTQLLSPEMSIQCMGKDHP